MAARRRARDCEVHVLGYYDGARRLGTVIQSGRECEARSWPDEILLGTYANRRDACAAISAAHAQSRANFGRRL